MLRSFVCLLLLAMAPFASLAEGGPASEELSASDRRAIRSVVEAQLKALAADNPEQAFSYASPSIRSRFHDAAVFMDMVRRSYPMLIRPVSTSFFLPEGSADVVSQSVQFRDREGNLWRAIYELQRQPDKSWRISGCAVVPDDESSTT
jgi:hypothetical protein